MGEHGTDSVNAIPSSPDLLLIKARARKINVMPVIGSELHKGFSLASIHAKGLKSGRSQEGRTSINEFYPQSNGERSPGEFNYQKSEKMALTVQPSRKTSDVEGC